MADHSDDDLFAGEKPAFCILALYYFFPQEVPKEEVKILRNDIEKFLRRFETRGNILLATEGINGTICFPSDYTDEIKDFLLDKFPKLQTRISYHTENVFFRLKVRIKTEIVTMGVPEMDTEKVGTYVAPGPEWDSLIQDPECLVIDTRNEYEIEVGTFRHAVNPHTQSFVEFPEWIERQLDEQTHTPKSQQYKKIAMFCTGGIRCEKATSYCLDLLQKKNKQDMEVFHLKGGILAYLDQVPRQESLFEGECYVFDRRIAVQHGLRSSGTFTQCHACRQPLTQQDRQHHAYQFGICCHICYQERTKRRQRYEDRQKQFEICKKEGVAHMHDSKQQRSQRGAY